MTVYVDEPIHHYRRMVMCHMLADTDEELHQMAHRIGINRKWHQKPGTAHSHYDICKAKRALAIGYGAVEADRQVIGLLIKKKRIALSELTQGSSHG